MRRPIELSDVGMPAPEYPEECPSIPAAEFEARIAAVLAAVDADWVVVYGDREHNGSFVWLCNLDPRFEEALLVLGRDRRTLLLGKENVGYTSMIPAGLDFDVVCVPTFSLMGIDRSGFPTVEQALRDAGISTGDRVGVVGWKALLPEEWNGGYEAIFAPAFFVDTLRAITGDPALVSDATAVVTNPRDGLRTFCSADQIAVFEWGAARCSAWVSLILRSVRPGMTEREAFHVVPWGGEPLSMHPVFSSGPEVAVGLRSPSTRRLELGDAGIVAIGLWGGNCARGGILAADGGDLRPESDGWLEGLAIPYWRVMATWHESLGLGVPGGEVFETVTEHARRRDVPVLVQPRPSRPLRGVARLADPRRLGRPDRERNGSADGHHPDRDPARLDGELRGHRGDRGRVPAGRAGRAPSRALGARAGAAGVRSRPPRDRAARRGAAALVHARVPRSVLALARPGARIRVIALHAAKPVFMKR